jgi:hypothetical protein
LTAVSHGQVALVTISVSAAFGDIMRKCFPLNLLKRKRRKSELFAKTYSKCQRFQGNTFPLPLAAADLKVSNHTGNPLEAYIALKKLEGRMMRKRSHSSKRTQQHGSGHRIRHEPQSLKVSRISRSHARMRRATRISRHR